MRILTDDMELAGDVLQEMTAALGVHELEALLTSRYRHARRCIKPAWQGGWAHRTR